ncbi:hypothetical protein KIW84_052033 [Lathyrus oleraceus]|uniref:Uncharacterized protein n=1 Tax=Pisum sativum TaxID=3888 RepID=A0A9D5ABF9_PEA|nr:hypothetical protein KIW84_052033 [Pisum sativum]
MPNPRNPSRSPVASSSTPAFTGIGSGSGSGSSSLSDHDTTSLTMEGKENGESVVRYLNGISSPSPLPKKNLDYFEARQHLLYVGWEVKKDEIGVFYLSPEQEEFSRSVRPRNHLRSAFCTEECKLAFNDMEPLLFKVDRISEEFSWTSMKGNNTLPRFLQNPMLLTAAQLVRSAFDYDVIPDLLFGYGMYAGFYTHAMWKKSDLVCAITFRIHSRAKEVFGEVPYIVTAEEYCGRGCLKVDSRRRKSEKVEEKDSNCVPVYFNSTVTATVCPEVVTAGEDTELLVGVKNDGESGLNVVAIKASIHLPVDHRLYVQNLTAQVEIGY